MEATNTVYSVNSVFKFKDEEFKNQDISLIAKDGDLYTIHYNQISYQVRVKFFDAHSKTATLNVNGYDYQVKMDDALDQLIQALGFLKNSKQSIKDVKSPMPGLVVDIFVQEGQVVGQGDKLLSLEAMKMENILKSIGDGVVKKIFVQKGSSVDKNQILLEFE